MKLSFEVSADPVPQGSKRIGRSPAGVPIVLDTNRERLIAWREDVAMCARMAMRAHPPIAAPVRVQLLFRLRRPERPRFERPAVKPDLDKLVRAVLDALTDARVIVDDALVVDLYAAKTYGAPGVLISVAELREEVS